MLRKLLLVVLGCTVFITEEASAADTWALPFDESSWHTVKVPGTAENAYSISNGSLTVRADKSASFRYVELPRDLQDAILVGFLQPK